MPETFSFHQLQIGMNADIMEENSAEEAIHPLGDWQFSRLQSLRVVHETKPRFNFLVFSQIGLLRHLPPALSSSSLEDVNVVEPEAGIT